MGRVGHWAAAAKARSAGRGVIGFGWLSCSLSLLLPVQAGATTPGTPGTAQAPTTIYSENFSNQNATSAAISILNYTGAGGQTYTADPIYQPSANQCDGYIMNSTTPVPSDLGCPTGSGTSGLTEWQVLQSMAIDIGLYQGQTATQAAQNQALTEFTSFSPFPDYRGIELLTQNSIPATAGHYYIASAVYGATNCHKNLPAASDPLLTFSLIVNGTANVVGSNLNPCTAANATQYPSGTPTQTTVYVANLSSSVLKITNTGSPTLGLQLYNGQHSGYGNDSIFDLPQIIDVTPQLDKAFLPTNVPVGGTSTLTLTITNTTDLLAKNGWSFTDTLPSGLTITTPAATTTCSLGSGGALTAAAGTSSISLSNGNLNLNQTSCTVTVTVTSSKANTYTNTGCVTNTGTVITPCTSNFTLSGLNPPGTATVTFVGANISIGKTDNSPTYTPCSTTNYLVTVTNTGVATGVSNPPGASPLDNTFAASGATGLTFSDTLPSGVTLTGPTTVAFTGGATCPTATAGTAPGTGQNILSGYTCTMPALTATGATAPTATIVFTIPVKYACTASSY